MFGRIAQKTATQMKVAGARNISRSAARMGGDGHHQHYVFEGEFSKAWCKGLFAFVVGGGVGATLLICKFQNWKNGFPRQEE